MAGLAWPRTRSAPASVGVGVLAVTALVVLLAATVRYSPPELDALLHAVVHGRVSTLETQVAVGVTTAGSSVVLYPITAILAALISQRHGWSRLADAVVVPIILAVGSGLRFGLSLLVARARPPASDWLHPATGFAFPSGHTSNTTIAVGLLVLLYRATRPPAWARGVAWVAAVSAAGAVGWSRVYLGVHWPSDVAGGWAFGVWWVGMVGLVGRALTGPAHR